MKEIGHVTYMKKKIISIGELGGEGFLTTFRDKTWKVTKGTLVIEKGEKVVHCIYAMIFLIMLML